MEKTLKTRNLVIMGLMTAVLFLMAYTPLGYLKAGPLDITFNTIPVALSAVALGPLGGAIAGGVFGLTSFLQCFGRSTLGTALFGINPALTLIQCIVPRILEGLCAGFICNFLRKKGANAFISSAITGFSAAFLNTLFYMSSLVILFGNTELIRGYREKVAPGKNVFIFVCLFIGINAVVEWISTTALTGAVGAALSKAGLIKRKELA